MWLIDEVIGTYEKVSHDEKAISSPPRGSSPWKSRRRYGAMGRRGYGHREPLIALRPLFREPLIPCTAVRYGACICHYSHQEHQILST